VGFINEIIDLGDSIFLRKPGISLFDIHQEHFLPPLRKLFRKNLTSFWLSKKGLAVTYLSLLTGRGILETASGKPTVYKTTPNGKGLEGALSAIEEMMAERLD
jgi:hypothetical protein